MGITPWRVGQTYPKWRPTPLYDNGAVVDLSSATAIALIIRDARTGVERAGGGSWFFLPDASGTMVYTWGASDVEAAGQYVLLVKITFTDNTILYFDEIDWTVLPA